MIIRRRELPEYVILPEFFLSNPLANISRANARIDRFEIRYPNHQIQCVDYNALRRFITQLTRQRAFKAVFTGGSRQSTTIDFDSTRYQVSGDKIKFYGSGNIYSFSLTLNINYTRFYQANIISRAEMPDISPEDRTAYLYGYESIYDVFSVENPNLSHARGLTLDRNDNMFTHSRWRDAGNVMELLPYQLAMCQNYIENNFDFIPTPNQAQDDEADPVPENDIPLRAIREHIDPATGLVPRDFLRQVEVAPVFRWQNCTIPHLEVYWDFQCNDAIHIAKQLRPAMEQISTRMLTRYYRFRRETEMNLCAHSTLDLINNVRLSVYAKTPRRLRLEVVYYERSLQSLFAGHVPNNASLTTLLDYALNDATERLRGFKLLMPDALLMEQDFWYGYFQ